MGSAIGPPGAGRTPRRIHRGSLLDETVRSNGDDGTVPSLYCPLSVGSTGAVSDSTNRAWDGR